MRLLIFQVYRIDIGYGAVTIPLEKGDIGTVGHQVVDHTENKILHIGVAQIQHHLITGSSIHRGWVNESPNLYAFRKVRSSDLPFRVLSIIQISRPSLWPLE